MNQTIIQVLQIIVAFGLLNVWLVRANWATSYRGGNAKNIKEEFAVYGLPGWFCTAIGFAKVTLAILLLAGLWFPFLIFPAAAIIAVLMIGAVAMHVKVGDSIAKTMPAATMLSMNVIICLGFVV